MATSAQANLVKLGDTDYTVADPAEDVRGRKVLDRAGDEVGHVDALMIDQRENKVRFLRVASGGFLGFGERTYLIPVDAVTKVDADHVHVDQGRERIGGSPAYDPDLAYDQGYFGDVYGYYGYGPFWGAGYVYPRYPYYI